ncbi:MAG: rhomboid family intramembrane serine protease [Planctomycetota bacterium]
MIVPYGTDAPIYYLPVATAGLIVVNTMAFFSMASGSMPDPEQWLLPYGQGWTPLQWFTSMFMHADVFHLIGNMIFLGVFGLLVEGKVGWWKFLLCYLTVGVLQSVLEQGIQIALGGEGFSLGASSAIYGIMAIAAVWMPMADIRVWYWFFFFMMGTGEIRTVWFAAFFIGMDLFYSAIEGVNSSAWLHVGGVLVGAPLGVAMYKLGLVDCEGWDIFHVIRGDEGAKKEKAAAEERRVEQQKDKQQQAFDTGPEKIAWLLEQGSDEPAFELYKRLRHLGGPVQLPRATLLKMIAGLHRQERWRESCPLMADCLKRFPEGTEGVRVKLAQICLIELQRPNKALEVLRGLDVQKLPTKLVPLTKKVAAAAQQMVREGHVELDTEAW